ncbi:MAG TPA: transglutaminase-like domain-containing protein [Planctomycetota bacterium]|nr:transglutaminase-like domain-containing protein [Planctomycetota bacterium]
MSDLPLQRGGPGPGHAGPARLATLIDLFGDPSPTVWRAVRRGLAELGGEAWPAVRRLARHGTALERGRARLLLLRRERERAARRLVRFAATGALDLERGLLLLSRFEDPEFDARATLAALDALAAELSQRLETRRPGLDRSLELARYLGAELGYDGDREDYHHPDNIYLHRVLVRRRGLPLSLTALYLCVARRTRIEAAPVALPGHVVLRLRGHQRHALLDPFHAGRRISERDCLGYLARNGLPFRPEWFADASDAELFERQVRNLCASYTERGLAREVELLELVLEAGQRRSARHAVAEERA